MGALVLLMFLEIRCLWGSRSALQLASVEVERLRVLNKSLGEALMEKEIEINEKEAEMEELRNHMPVGNVITGFNSMLQERSDKGSEQPSPGDTSPQTSGAN
jgi:hypothetical protein